MLPRFANEIVIVSEIGFRPAISPNQFGSHGRCDNGRRMNATNMTVTSFYPQTHAIDNIASRCHVIDNLHGVPDEHTGFDRYYARLAHNFQQSNAYVSDTGHLILLANVDPSMLLSG